MLDCRLNASAVWRRRILTPSVPGSSLNRHFHSLRPVPTGPQFPGRADREQRGRIRHRQFPERADCVSRVCSPAPPQNRSFSVAARHQHKHRRCDGIASWSVGCPAAIPPAPPIVREPCHCHVRTFGDDTPASTHDPAIPGCGGRKSRGSFKPPIQGRNRESRTARHP